MNQNYDQQSHLFLKEEIVWLFFQMSRKNNTNIITSRTKNFLLFLKNILDGKNLSIQNKDHTLWLPYLNQLFTLVAFTRDSFIGLGEHDLFYSFIFTLFEFYPSFSTSAIDWVVKPLKHDLYNQNLGCWRDIKFICQLVYQNSHMKTEHPIILHCVHIINKQLHYDIETWKFSKNCYSIYHISNVAKHIPREKTKFSWLFQLLAIDWVKTHQPYIFKFTHSDTSYQKAVAKSKRTYRKIIAYLNKHLSTPEIYICRKKHIETPFISYHTFFKNNYILSNQDKCLPFHKNISLPPSDNHSFFFQGHNFSSVGIEYIIKKCVHIHHNPQTATATEIQIINSLWKNYFIKNYTFNDYIIPLLDVSNCTNNDSFFAALGNSIILSHHSIFSHRILAIDKFPTWIYFNENSNIVEQVSQIINSIYNMSNTIPNFNKAFHLIASSFKSIKATNKDINKIKLVLLSQFLHSCSYEDLLNSFNYFWFSSTPILIFWNFSNQDSTELPFNIQNNKCFALSGFSQKQIYNILYFTNNKLVSDSYSFVCKVLSNNRYSNFYDFGSLLYSSLAV
tara:strand:+ start:15880 stop:17565 length:1686 start_codon:yes stop_codon:yes gene_type:complete